MLTVLLSKQLVPPPPDLDQCPNCDSVFLSLESERRETSRLTKENKALVNGMFQLQAEVVLHASEQLSHHVTSEQVSHHVTSEQLSHHVTLITLINIGLGLFALN